MSDNKENLITWINGVLSEAEDSNQKELGRSAPDFAAMEEAEIEAAKPVKKEKVKPAITEEQEIINEYGGKKKTAPDMSTKRLRKLLADHADDSGVLTEFFAENADRPSKHVENLLALLNGTAAEIEEEKAWEPIKEETAAEEEGGRLSDEAPEKETFVQESLFGSDETEGEEKPLDTGARASFDEDFASLGDKINRGEIKIDTEEENADQITLGVDSEEEVIKTASSENEKDKKLKYLFNMLDGESLPPIEEEDAKEEGEEKEEKKAKATADTKKKKKKKKKKAENAFEYTDRAQNNEIASMLSRAVAISRLKLIGVAIITFLILYMEIGTYSSDRSPFLRQGRFGIIYILADLQLLFFIIMLMKESFINGLKSFLGFKLTADSVMSASVIGASLLCLVSLAADPSRLDLQLFNLPAAAGATALALVRHLQCIKDKRAFLIIASKKPKLTTKPLKGNTGEAGEFYKYLDESSDLFTVKKTDFVEGFFKRTTRRPDGEDIFNFLLPAAFAASVALFLTCFLINNDLYSAFRSAVMLFVAACPIGSFFMLSLPVISAGITANRNKAAFIGNAVAEEYADAAVLSFADVEAFRPHLTSLGTVVTYGDYPVDKVLTRLGMLYDYIGGPLKTVTAKMLNKLPKPDSIRLMGTAADGLHISMDGTDYYLGKRSYMRHCSFETPEEDEDSSYLRKANSVMYMAINDTIVAKIYIKYGINAEFDELLRSMHRAGVCVGIKTLDPNINNELLQKNLGYKQCPVAILKAGSPEELDEVTERMGSGIVSTSGLHTFLKMFILCDRARHASRSNCIINIGAVLMAVLAVFFLAVTGCDTSYGSLSVLVFQLMWLLPSVAMSFLL